MQLISFFAAVIVAYSVDLVSILRNQSSRITGHPITVVCHLKKKLCSEGFFHHCLYIFNVWKLIQNPAPSAHFPDDWCKRCWCSVFRTTHLLMSAHSAQSYHSQHGAFFLERGLRTTDVVLWTGLLGLVPPVAWEAKMMNQSGLD